MSVRDQEVRSLTKNSEDAPLLGIAIPCRKRSPVEFWMCMFALLPPLNTKIGYMIHKADERHVKNGALPAAARNELLQRGLNKGMKYVFFVDDDVLFHEITLYRMWVQMQKHPEIACTTAVGGTKLTPSEPLIYQVGVQGAYWDWHLGVQIPIESAWAGCMLVNMDYVKKLEPPWFNDQVVGPPGEPGEKVKLNIMGHDRYFHNRLREEAGGLVVADTGLLVAHFDADLQKSYIFPPDAPPFKRDILGETFIPFHDDHGGISWKRIYIPDTPDTSFKTYLEWLQEQHPYTPPPMTIIPTDKDHVKEDEPKIVKVEERDGFTVRDSRKSDFSQWLNEVGAKIDG